MAAKYDGRKVTLKWKLPGSPVGEILISRLDEPPKAKECELFNVSEIPILKRFSGDATICDDYEVRLGDVYYYAFYTVKRSVAVYCGCLEVALFEEVKNLIATNQQGEVYLTWDWPESIDYVQVVRHRLSAGGTSKKKEWSYTRGQYDMNGSMMCDKVNSCPCKYRYYIHTVRRYRGKTVTSLGTSTEVIGGKLPTITYKLKKGRKKVVVTCDISEFYFPFSGLVLRKKESERPIDINDGVEVDRWKRIQPQRTVLLEDRDPEFNGNTYYQVFLADPREAEIVKIEAPPINELRV
jgi:hypothetical protein